MRVSPSRGWHLNLCFFFFNDTATTEIYTLSLHDALPISQAPGVRPGRRRARQEPQAELAGARRQRRPLQQDRKSTRLNSSHTVISYAVFCLKKKNSNFTAFLTWLKRIV